MNKGHLLYSANIATIASIVLFHCFAADAENANASLTNIPKSIFVIPKDAKDGRDPFYPNSDRLSKSGTNETVVSAVKVPLILNGLSGASGHRLAMINGRTLAEGESSDVPSGGSLVKVHCVEIKENSVVVEVGGSRQELTMRGDK